jgi:hypothetical protein
MIDIRDNMLKYRVFFIILFFFSAIATSLNSQVKDVKETFAQAESFYLFGDFETANPLYLTIAAYVPDNYNIIYKIGECYLNIPGEKSKAIEFLEKAVKNSSYESKTDQLKEKRAPLDSYFSLAKAYLINNELEKALATLKTFEKLVGDTKQKGGMKNTEFIKQEIFACDNAIKLEANPVSLLKEKMPADFSMGAINDNPAVSFDGNVIAYTERRGLANAIYYSRKERGKWQPPVDITMTINAGEDCSTCALNNDGTEMFLYKEDNFDGNIYSSSFTNGSWSPVKKLNKNINTKFYESHASVSADGKKLYFSSNREGGQGQLDIYISEKDASGDWGPAVNMGAVINTTFNEDTPFILKNDSVIYFSSEGHSTMGGYDIFKSQKIGNVWKTPQNLGYPINSTDDDKFFQPAGNGIRAYYSMTTDYKKKEIFYLGIGTAAFAQKFEIKGKYSLADTLVYFDSNNKIYLSNTSSGDTLDIGYPNKYSGQYNFLVTPGKYKIIYSGTGFISQTIDTTILGDNPDLDITLNVTLLKDPNYIKAPVNEVQVPEQPVVYEKIDLTAIPAVEKVDTTMLITNMKVSNVSDKDVKDADVLYYTVQVMALHNPVDVSYFKYITDMKVLYNDQDKFYRYTTGRFVTNEQAVSRRAELLRKGYPDDIFIKKVSKQ